MEEITIKEKSLASRRTIMRPWLLGPLLVAVYIASSRLGLEFATITSNVTLIWPPTGIALFALLVFGVRFWPAIFVGALAATYTTNIPAGAVFAIATGNCLEAVAGYHLLKLAGFQNQIPRVRDVVLLVLLAAGLSTAISASVGSVTLAYANVIPWEQVGKTWLTWWMGDAMGDLVFASFLLAWWHGADDSLAPARRFEAVVLLAMLVGISQFVFGARYPAEAEGWPFAFMTFPFLTWAALRFGMRGATGATLVIGLVALSNIIAGVGLFSRPSPVESLLLLWLYANVMVVTSMVLAASVSERCRAEARLRHQSQHDYLTGLVNRLTLQARINQSIRHAERHGGQFALLFIDIDRFKVINDSLGHSIGDQLLSLVGNRLQEFVRSEDTLSRHGGDEFVIVIEGILKQDDVNKVAQKLLEKMREPFVIEDASLHVSASIGISFYPNDGHDADTLLKNADTAMYRAKEMGRSCFAYYSSEMNARANEQFVMENELRQALARNEFQLQYQPQYDVDNGRVVGAEALVRWQRDRGPLTMPETFIRLLEETGLINQVGGWVLDNACAQLAVWQRHGAVDLRMAVNVSSHQLREPALLVRVTNALRKHSLSPHSLELEITESMLVRQDPVVVRNLQHLTQLGVRLAVDDFGTGYSSLSYLYRLSINTLKIDRSFVNNLPGDENSAAIARAIVGLGSSLHLELVAEGIETAAQRDFIRELGCHVMQGNLFSSPVNPADFEKLLGPDQKTVHTG